MAQEVKVFFDANTNKISTKLSDLQKQTGKAKEGFASLVPSLRSVGVAGAAAFATIGAAALKSLKDFSRFDNQLRGVKTLLNESSFGAKGLEKGFSDLTKQTLSLAAESPVAIDSLNKALFDTISAGVDAGDAVRFLGDSANLAVAGLTDISVATDGLTSVTNAFSLSAEKSTEVAAAFFGAQKAGKTTVEKLSRGIGLVAGTFDAAGLSYESLLSATAALTAGSLRTNAAFTGLKAAVANINQPTERAREEAERLGITFNASALRAKGLKGFLDQVTQSANFNNQSFIKLFNSSEAFNAISILANSQSEKFAQTLDNLNDKTKLQDEFNKAVTESSDSLENQYKLLTNAVDVLSISIGQKLEPVAKAAVKATTELVNSITGFVGVEEARKQIKGLSKDLSNYERNLSQLPEKNKAVFGPTIAADIETTKDKIGELIKKYPQLAMEIKNAGDILKSLPGDTQEAVDKIIENKQAEGEAEREAIIEQEALKTELLQSIKAERDLLEKNRKELIKKQDKKDATLELKRLTEYEKNQELIKKNAEKQRLLEKAKTNAELTKIREKQDADDIKAEKRKLETQKRIDMQRMRQRQIVAQSILSAAGNLNEALFTLTGKRNKALFALEKAAALANIAINTALAFSKAGAQLGVFAAPAQAAIVAAGVAQAALVSAQTIQGFQEGGVAVGGVNGRDSIPALLSPGEIVSPKSSFDEVIGSVRAKREAEKVEGGTGLSGQVELVVGMKDDFIEVVEQRIVERQNLGISILGAV